MVIKIETHLQINIPLKLHPFYRKMDKRKSKKLLAKERKDGILYFTAPTEWIEKNIKPHLVK